MKIKTHILEIIQTIDFFKEDKSKKPQNNVTYQKPEDIL